jgi:DNA-binding NtrC family response regulator
MNNDLFKILIVDDEQEYRDVFSMILEESYITDTASSGEEALEKLKEKEYDLVLTDLIMGGMNGLELLKNIKEKRYDVEVIIVTGYGTIENAVEAMKQGAFTYFVKGHDPEELIEEIEKIRKTTSLNNDKKHEHNTRSLGFMLDTKNHKFKKTIEIAEKAAKSNINILLLGESGVGKEVFARYIHNCSERRNEAFIPVNCQAFSSGLIESELFGHEKGAFTGAGNKRKGRFEAADEGTLFLDEVGDIPLDTQVKLLRIIETKSIERIGSNELRKIDFRLIAATNKNLQKEINKGEFREDFFYRISTITIEIPPLRERKEDLEVLIDFFLKKSQKEHKINIVKIEDGVMKFLLSYDYPGNVRELKNIIERLVVLSENGVILKRGLPDSKKSYEVYEEDFDVIRPLKEVRKEMEAEYIEKVLEMCEGNISEAARKLDISRRQLFNKISEYELR